MMTEIKGKKSFLFFEESESTECFEAGGKKLFVYDDTFDLVIVNGIIKFADNSTAHCLLKINEQENGELIDVGVWTRVDGVCPIVFASHPKFLSFLGKKRADVFPYTYHYSVPINCDDKHIGTDGWSHSCNLHDPENRVMRIAGLSFLDLCPGTDRDRLSFLRQEFPGTMEGYYNLYSRVKIFGVSHCFVKNK